jgi:hypothetical protein
MVRSAAVSRAALLRMRVESYSFAQVATTVDGAVQAAPPDDMAGALSPSEQ